MFRNISSTTYKYSLLSKNFKHGRGCVSYKLQLRQEMYVLCSCYVISGRYEWPIQWLNESLATLFTTFITVSYMQGLSIKSGYKLFTYLNKSDSKEYFLQTAFKINKKPSSTIRKLQILYIYVYKQCKATQNSSH